MFLFFFSTRLGVVAEFNPVFNKLDSFHNFRYIQSIPEESREEEEDFAPWVDRALALVLGQKRIKISIKEAGVGR